MGLMFEPLAAVHSILYGRVKEDELAGFEGDFYTANASIWYSFRLTQHMPHPGLAARMPRAGRSRSHYIVLSSAVMR